MKFVPSKSTEILSRVRVLAKEERKLTLEILHLISAVETRKIYADLGYASAFAWLVEDLGYSHGAADRRLKSSRLLRAVPEISQKIESGTVNLTTLSQTQRAIQMNERQSGEKATTEAKRNLTEMITSKSSQETERLLSETFPELHLSSERVSALSGQKTRLNLVLTEEQWQKLEDVKALGSHVFGHSSWAEIIESLADRFLKGKLGPAPKGPFGKKHSSDDLEKSFPVKFHKIPKMGISRSHQTNIAAHPSLFQKLGKNIQSESRIEASQFAPINLNAFDSIPSDPAQPTKIENKKPTSLKSKQEPLTSPQIGSVGSETPETQSSQNQSAGLRISHEIDKKILKESFNSTHAESVRMRSARTESLRTESAADYRQRTLTDGSLGSPNHEKRHNKTSRPPQEIAPLMNQSPLSKSLARRIRQRDQECCTYRNPKTGKLCGSRYFVQIDHIQPRVLGGPNEIHNLRCLCSTHNQWRSQRAQIHDHAKSL